MGDGGPERNGFANRVLGAAAAVVPILLVAVVATYFVTRGEQQVRSEAPAIASSGGEAPVADKPVRTPEQSPANVAAHAESAAAALDGENPVVRIRSGERVAMLDQPRGDPVARVGDETEFGSPTVLSVVSSDGGWVGVSSPLLPNDELGWIRADPEKLRAGWVDMTILVDLSDRVAWLIEAGERVRSWPVTIGAPGTETPTGRFAVTDTFRGGLNPVYGCCAVALTATQPNLPSGWAGGNRIAFHGNGTGGPIGAAASNGCIRSPDRHVNALVERVPLGTPVRIRS